MQRLMTPSRVVLLIGFVVSGIGVGTLAAPIAADAAGGYRADGQECAFLDEINDFRRRNNKKALKLSASLGRAAEDHSRRMAAKGKGIYHASPSNFDQNGYKGSPTGENVSGGYATAKGNLNAWANSSGHRQNMLNGDFEAIGIGRAYNKNSTYGWYWTTTFGGELDETIRKC